jgi:hypothetical protein
MVGGESPHIEADFMMTNVSQKEIVLAERSNSWGAFQWSFKLTDALGHVFKFGNTQAHWERNAFTTFEISPGKSVVYRCSLSIPYQGSGDDANFGFSVSQGLVPDDSGGGVLQANSGYNAWVLPVELEGVFAAPELHRVQAGERTIETNWTGTVVTQKVILEDGISSNQGISGVHWLGFAIGLIVACFFSFVAGVAFARRRQKRSKPTHPTAGNISI